MSEDREARIDAMVAVMAHEIVDGDLVGVGLGTPLAIVAALAARASHAPDSHVLVGGAVDPDVGLAGCLMGAEGIVGHTSGYVPHLETMEMAERQAMTLQFIRPAQVDGCGRCNVSAVTAPSGRRIRLPGGLAIADVPALLPRLVVFLPEHRRRNLVRAVDRVTGGTGWHGGGYTAEGVTTIVTDLAVISLRDGAPRLAARFPGISVERIVEQTGFELAGVEEAAVFEIGAEDVAALEVVDPDGLRYRAA